MSRCILATLAVCFGCTCTAVAKPAPKVYVVLWFDTEDYVLPASDDAAKTLADWLHREGIRATFKIVGEKARTLEKRKRTDVIESLKNHEIGYHSNWHSVQPSPAMYLSNLGWDEGTAEFDRREKPGYDDVKRIFGVAPSCYGQPGSSWGPQSFGVMRKWGMPVYLDAGRHVGLEGRPHYFCGLLTLYHLTYTQRTALGGDADLKVAEEKFVEARKKLLAEGGGFVSIVYHPCEFVHRQFWDGVNFQRGANPPREEWKLPPTKTAEESKRAYDTFYSYIRFIKRFPEVEFITALDAAAIYRDTARGRTFSDQELKALCRDIRSRPNSLGHLAGDDWRLSAAEAFDLLTNRITSTNEQAKASKLSRSIFGPTSEPTVTGQPFATSTNQFLRSATDVAAFLDRQGRVPATVWLGSQACSPESFLVAIAEVAESVIDQKPLPETIEMRPARLGVEKCVVDDAPNLWGWVIFPPGFRAPKMMALGRLQTWTIKPAVNHGSDR